MDFITLATEQRRFLRVLEEMLGDDDETAAAGLSSSAAAPEAQLSILSQQSEDAARPLFGKDAEAELLLLATNFLLYTAMVIVVILVCRVYFPEALQSRVVHIHHHGRRRNYDYRVAQEQLLRKGAAVSSDEGEDFYGSDESDSDEAEEILDSSTGSAMMMELQDGKNFLEFQQESLSRKQVLQRLVFCCIMLNVTFVAWGALQVRCAPELKIKESRVLFNPTLTLSNSLIISILCSVGTHADPSLSSLYWRVLYVFVRFGFYESLLDTHHVGNVAALPQTATFAVGRHLRVQLSKHLQYAFQLVSI